MGLSCQQSWGPDLVLLSPMLTPVVTDPHFQSALTHPETVEAMNSFLSAPNLPDSFYPPLKGGDPACCLQHKCTLRRTPKQIHLWAACV